MWIKILNDIYQQYDLERKIVWFDFEVLIDRNVPEKSYQNAALLILLLEGKEVRNPVRKNWRNFEYGEILFLLNSVFR